MRCAYQDVECVNCPKLENCGIPLLIADLQRQTVPKEVSARVSKEVGIKEVIIVPSNSVKIVPKNRFEKEETKV